jgi:hypothetical protein
MAALPGKPWCDAAECAAAVLRKPLRILPLRQLTAHFGHKASSKTS